MSIKLCHRTDADTEGGRGVEGARKRDILGSFFLLKFSKCIFHRGILPATEKKESELAEKRVKKGKENKAKRY